MIELGEVPVLGQQPSGSPSSPQGDEGKSEDMSNTMLCTIGGIGLLGLVVLPLILE